MGTIMQVMNTKDSTAKPVYFIYEKDAINYVVFDLQNEIQVYTGKKTS